MKEWKENEEYFVNDEISKKPKKKYFFAKSLKRQTVAMIISVFVVLTIMMGTSYAIFSSLNKSDGYNEMNVGDLHITYNDESGAVALTNSFPVSDTEGLNGRAYTFSIQNTGSLATAYSIKLLDDDAVIDEEAENDDDFYDKLLEKSDIKVSVNGENPVILDDIGLNDWEIASGSLQPGETKKFQVRVWIKSDASNDIFFKDENGNLVGKYYFGMITVSGENTKTYETDSMLMWLDAKNKNDPVLPEGYKRVEYLESTGTQFINTGYYAKQNTEIESNLNILQHNGNDLNYMFGVYEGIRSFGVYLSPTSTVYGVLLGNVDKNTTQSIYYNVRHKYKLNKNALYIDGVNVYNVNYNGTFTSTMPVYIFWGSGSSRLPGIIRMYDFVVREDNNKTMNLIPCLDSSNRPCMYDTVTRTTFYNQGTGEFNYGQVVSTNDNTKWYDLSGNSNYAMSNFTNSSWNTDALNINGSVSNIGLDYDVSSLETYSMSTAFKLNASNSGQVNIFNNNDVNVYLSNNKLMYGDIDSGITLENNELYTVTLMKKKKYTMNSSGTKTSSIVLEAYVNGEFNKDITNANKTVVTSGNINIDIYNYLVYSKTLSINEDNRNYRLTLERYGD